MFVTAGIDWCRANGIQVINMSLDSPRGSATWEQACDNAHAGGIVVIAAAGNTGNSSATGDSVQYPARYDSVIAVAATDSGNWRDSDSSTGPAVELAAPGVNIQTTLYAGGYGSTNGTSMAAPHVAGVAALIIRANPGTSSVGVREAMTSTAVDLGAAGRDSVYGHGLVNAPAAVRAGAVIPSAPPTTPSVTVWITDTGMRYHRSSGLRQSSITLGLEDAKARGLHTMLGV